jgi:glycosyltransferase involved in cell wall biosynthesis
MRFFLQSADMILLETQMAVNFMKVDFPSANIAVHTNYRKISDIAVTPHEQCRRFIYLGRVRKNKGILEIIEAAESIKTEDLVVDIYGPFEGDLSQEIFDNLNIVKYGGIIDPAVVSDLLSNYDALLLPTFYEGEGHPGAILEAYASGLPVIASNRPSIAEIVDESSGILISPRDFDSLRDAMIKLMSEPDFYHNLIRGALNKRQDFSLTRGVERFLAICDDLIEVQTE